MATWPAGLPQKQFSGLVEKRQNVQLRSTMDTGAPKKRKRFTAALRNFNIPIVFSMAEKVIFSAFYIDTLGEGVLSFDWTDPDDDSTTISFGFTDSPSLNKNGGTWTGSLPLEIIPS